MLRQNTRNADSVRTTTLYARQQCYYAHIQQPAYTSHTGMARQSSHVRPCRRHAGGTGSSTLPRTPVSLPPQHAQRQRWPAPRTNRRTAAGTLYRSSGAHIQDAALYSTDIMKIRCAPCSTRSWPLAPVLPRRMSNPSHLTSRATPRRPNRRRRNWSLRRCPVPPSQAPPPPK